IRLLALPAEAEQRILQADMNVVTDAQKEALILAAVATDRQYDVMQTPKITVSSGQRGSIELIDYQFFLTGLNMSKTDNGQVYYSPNNQPYELGFRSTVCPTVSADRQSVSLDLHVKRKTLRDTNIPLIPVQIPIPQV